MNKRYREIKRANQYMDRIGRESKEELNDLLNRDQLSESGIDKPYEFEELDEIAKAYPEILQEEYEEEQEEIRKEREAQNV